MVQVEKRDEQTFIKKFRGLSSEKRQQLLDFLEFLASREDAKKWLEFDEWALNLAKERGFGHLTEEDIARIVSDFRSGK